MDIDPNDLPQDISVCHDIIRALLDALAKEEQLTSRVQHQLAQLLRHRYGQRSDRVDPNQLLLFAMQALAAEEGNAEAAAAARPAGADEAQEPGAETPVRKGHGRKRLPAHLPRERVLHDVDAEDKICSTCRRAKVRIGEEVSEQLEYEPASLRVIQHVRPVYACPDECEGQVATASKPYQPIEKGLPGPGMLAQVVVSKYGDHLPLHRQEDIFKRHGLRISRQTQWNWVWQSALMVQPLWRIMIEEVLRSSKIHTDDTPVSVLDRDRTKTRTGRFWAYIGDWQHPHIVYDYTPTRERIGPMNFLKGFRGHLQVDAYGGYDGLFADENVLEVACWAHTRRYYVEAQSAHPAQALIAIGWIRRLYAVESEAKEYLASLPQDMDPAEQHGLFVAKRLELRQEQSKPVLAGLRGWLEGEQRQALPKSPLGQAIGYTLNNWQALERYGDNGELEMDNNAAENALRGIAVGRSNWQFLGGDRGGTAAAILYSLVQTCKRHGISPFEYLRDIFSRMGAHPKRKLAELLPDRWKASHRQHAGRAAAPVTSPAPDT